MEIQIKPEDINKQLADAVLKSALGESIKKAVDKLLNESSSYYLNDSVKDMIKCEFRLQVQQYIQENFKEKIIEVAEAWIKGDGLKEYLDKLAEKMITKLGYVDV